MSELIERQAAIDGKISIQRANGVEIYSDEAVPVEYLKNLPTIQPEPHYDEWCTSCKEYDHERHCCPRWNHVIRTTLQDAQPEPQEEQWIKHETPDGGEQYECSRCGVLWEFNDGTPEDNEAYFCPKCGTKMKGERQK